MANFKVFSFISTLTKPLTCSFVRPNLVPHRGSMWSPRYLNPTISKEELSQELDETDARKYQPIKAAKNNQTTSIFYDPIIAKFTNMVMKDGKKQVAVTIIDKMLTNIKIAQILKYHSVPDVEKIEIELNPLTIFHEALENVKPVLTLTKVYKGGVRYNVPIACSPATQNFLAMKWIIHSCRDKERKKVPSFEKLADEILAAYKNEGRSIRKKQDLHRQCEANKAFAHFRW